MSATPSRHLVIMAAGTGGHIMPGLAVAREMQARGWTVSWLGTTTGMENRLVPPTGIPMDTLGFSGLRGKGLLHTLTGGLRLLKAFVDCFRIIGQRRADAVLGMGGYVCFPGGLMASLRGKPLVLVNADAALLMSNKALLPVVDAIEFGFDCDDVKGLANRHRIARVTGNPVRAEIEAIEPPAQRFAARTGPLRVLVVGGSLGAKVLNDTLPEALAKLPPEQRPRLTHQTGLAQFEAVRSRYGKLGIALEGQVEVLPFIDNMAERLADCDVIVCRAGAITVSELCAAGVASVLVPLVVSTTSHQRDNAQYMAANGAAIHLPQGELNADSLAALLGRLNRSELLNMATQARTLAKARAAAAVADDIEQLSNKKGPAR
ncbi:undecaprenyldiphospho-muramoylpentapeptide beta-N-acetylglucosaminyltransferase [Aquabacterium lacunae]|uniref:UDP-N-acetylglucosamine--N-acetylmuramyl-(pentapeptide) pyrophosphoryl-undecaprenol N-acetylglucosamine transferase n=1 Tax=Aquabacterium lacunae TaxID=2528630 RepID=A0A4Q9GX56_9BURK|nr:undecaprenyldiphospho-muramoylpentapeptide beta-N-acetylglucosaminyltransferase [Aquabacterium lacunae]TBO29404.1 undecaprenyldiphospho-muramoylpentapeptide beta-N-acetylglucosaminyltransferase [Aquabacterium lacunae]